jgi:hypothetical protein
VALHDEAMRIVHDYKLHGKGLGWIGIHLLASVLLTGCSGRTNDKPLPAAAWSLRVDS